MNYIGAAKPLGDLDLPRIGSKIGVGEDVVHMVLDVEAQGSGFDRIGRPKMLFEPHIFWRELSGAERDRAYRQGLAYRRWGEQRYPRDSYPRLKRAVQINKNAAYRSASWGGFQIMGFNARLAGYNSAEMMIKAFMKDADNHLEAAINFIKNSGLDDELREIEAAQTKEEAMPAIHRFARGYNGSGYRRNNYHNKLWRALVWWRGKPDTPWYPEIDPEWGVE